MMRACIHLDHNPENYPSCTLVTLDNFRVQVKHWRRSEGSPQNVQFCGQGRGRINGIFQCYNEGEMSCYEPVRITDQPTPPAAAE